MFTGSCESGEGSIWVRSGRVAGMTPKNCAGSGWIHSEGEVRVQSGQRMGRREEIPEAERAQSRATPLGQVNSDSPCFSV